MLNLYFQLGYRIEEFQGMKLFFFIMFDAVDQPLTPLMMYVSLFFLILN